MGTALVPEKRAAKRIPASRCRFIINCLAGCGWAKFKALQLLEDSEFLGSWGGGQFSSSLYFPSLYFLRRGSSNNSSSYQV